MEPEPVVTTTLRLPASMMIELRHRAIDNRRSLNSEFAHRLQQTLDAEAEKAPNA